MREGGGASADRSFAGRGPAFWVPVGVRVFGVRTLLMWGTLRAVVSFGAGALGDELLVVTRVALVLVAAGAVGLSSRRGRERIFLANLGLPWWGAFALAAGLAGLLEVALTMWGMR